MSAAEKMGDRCAGCAAAAPACDTTYTLIQAHGWRISRGTNASGGAVLERWCASCWAKRRETELAKQAAKRTG